MISLEVKGLKAVNEHLSKMPIELQDKAIRRAGKESSEAVAVAARAKAPYDTNRRRRTGLHLRDALMTGMGKKHRVARQMGINAMAVTRSGNRTFRGLLTFLTGFKKGAAHNVPVNYGHVTRGHVHSEVAPVPFMREAFEQNIKRTLNIFENRLRQEIKRLWPGGSGRIS